MIGCSPQPPQDVTGAWQHDPHDIGSQHVGPQLGMQQIGPQQRKLQKAKTRGWPQRFKTRSKQQLAEAPPVIAASATTSADKVRILRRVNMNELQVRKVS
jgi:hypothetical protein